MDYSMLKSNSVRQIFHTKKQRSMESSSWCEGMPLSHSHHWSYADLTKDKINKSKIIYQTEVWLIQLESDVLFQQCWWLYRTWRERFFSVQNYHVTVGISKKRFFNRHKVVFITIESNPRKYQYFVLKMVIFIFQYCDCETEARVKVGWEAQTDNIPGSTCTSTR